MFDSRSKSLLVLQISCEPGTPERNRESDQMIRSIFPPVRFSRQLLAKKDLRDGSLTWKKTCFPTAAINLVGNHDELLCIKIDTG